MSYDLIPLVDDEQLNFFLQQYVYVRKSFLRVQLVILHNEVDPCVAGGHDYSARNRVREDHAIVEGGVADSVSGPHWCPHIFFSAGPPYDIATFFQSVE